LPVVMSVHGYIGYGERKANVGVPCRRYGRRNQRRRRGRQQRAVRLRECYGYVARKRAATVIAYGEDIEPNRFIREMRGDGER